MAGLALQSGVRAGEREAAQSVVEGGVSPGDRAVADGAIRGESAADVVGIGGLLKIGHVARRAGCRHRRVAAVHMALRAGHLGMRAAQRPAGHGMVEVHIHPRVGVVAGGTTGGESRRDVVGIAGGGPILGMATQAIHWGALEAAAYVTGGAVQRGVHAGEGKAGEAQVIEFRSEPGIHAVALLAGSGKARGSVIGIRGLLELRRVTAEAIGGEPLELPHGRILVAAVALQQRVRPHQRKAVEMLLDVLHGNPPAPYVVAVLATGSELPAMDIGVAVGAFCARVAEHQVAMALAAAHPLVHATQGEPGLVVVKLRHVADRLPGRECMAVLAGEIQVAMRAARGRIVWILRRSRTIHRRRLWRRSRGAQQKPDNHIYQQCRAQGISLDSSVSHEISYLYAVQSVGHRE